MDPGYGWIGMDCNGDGTIDRGTSSPEFKFAKHEVVVFRMGEHYVSTQSVDVASGKIVLRSHPEVTPPCAGQVDVTGQSEK